MTEKFSATIESFDSDECHMFQCCVLVPEELSRKYKSFSKHFGFIPITLKVGKSSWPTSLLPYNRGSHFINFPKKIREANSNIKPGAKITIEFELREK